MIKVAIVEDDISCSDELKSFFDRYEEEVKCPIEVDVFENADNFLADYKAGSYQMVFMDIEMPGTDGMTASKLIREKDDDVLLIFVTNLSQYALKGYEVHAYDFIVKPINYYNFALKMERAFVAVKNKADKNISISFNGEKRVIKVSSIRYVEVMDHSIIYHTTEGDFNEVTKTMSTIQKQLEDFNFVLCNRSFLVNLAFVTGTKDNVVYLGKDELPIAKVRRSEFVRIVSRYFSTKRK